MGSETALSNLVKNLRHRLEILLNLIETPSAFTLYLRGVDDRGAPCMVRSFEMVSKHGQWNIWGVIILQTQTMGKSLKTTMRLYCLIPPNW